MENITSKKGIDKEKAVKIAHIVYAVLIVLLAVAVGILFIVSCVDIYKSAEVSPFTTGAIESHFRAISVPVIAFPCLVVIGFVLHYVFPLESKQKKIENTTVHDTLSKRVNLELVDLGTKKSIIGERYFRFGVSIGAVLVWVAAIVIILVFALNPLNYSKANVNGSVKDLALVIFPSALIAMGMSFVASLSNALSKKRELTLLKAAVKQNKDALSKVELKANCLPPFVTRIQDFIAKAKSYIAKYENLSVWIARGAVFTLAVVFIVLGVINGGMADVLGKAIRICTECIGLG